MAVIAARQREFEAKNLADEVADFERRILDLEYAERLAHNPDWLAYARYFRADLEDRMGQLDDLRGRLLSAPMTPEEAVRSREEVMLLERDRKNAEDFLGLPQRLEGVLRNLRQELEVKKADLKKRKGEDHGS